MKIAELIDIAEETGFAKFTTDNGTKMVICTQDELDAVIRQAKDNKSQ